MAKTKSHSRRKPKTPKSSGEAVVALDLMDVFVLRRIDGDPHTTEYCKAEFVWKDGDVYNDDANDKPYEHNCGATYSDGSPVFTVLFKMPLGVVNAPCSRVLNSSVSLEEIREGTIAWMWPTTRDLLSEEDKRFTPKKIMDGDTLRSFVDFVDAYGGEIFVKANTLPDHVHEEVENVLSDELRLWEKEEDRYGVEIDKLGTKAERAEKIRESRFPR